MGEPLEKTMRLRTCVLKEILKTEKDYVETLRFLVQVFMSRLKGREEDENDKLVPDGSVKLLLSNVEELYAFHQEVLASIEGSLSPEPNYYQEIGPAFLKHKDQFKIYEPYCTNHERAQKKLNELTENQEFQGFVLGCLMLGNYVNDVSMEGFLLSPIQRMCKYPLLLKELLKKTPTNHTDYVSVKAACEVMKEVCSNVNETKRQLEQLEKLEEIQASISNWEGVNLTDTCTRLIKQGPLLKISVGNFQERQVFLFDHLLVYAKKINLPRLQSTVDPKNSNIRRTRTTKSKPKGDLQKKWLFKGRISTELMEIENLEDGANDYHCGGSSVTHAWKVLNAAKNKWFVLVAKSKEEKEAWLNEFIMEREKRKSKVSLDQRDNLDVVHAKGKKLYYRLTHQNLIQERRYKMRNYSKCFPGSELVSWLVENNESRNKDEAVLFGQALLDCGLIHHVQDKHHFQNEPFLYRFRFDDGTFKPRGENQDLIAKGLRVYCRIHCLFHPVVKDKDKNWKNHKYVVEGKKLIDWLVDQGDCQNRDEASNFGQTMCENGILHHASDKQDFKDDSSLFRFFPDEEVLELSKLREMMKKSSPKQEFKLQQQHLTKTLLLVNVSTADELGIQLKYVSDTSEVVIASVSKGSNAQMQGFRSGMVILQMNNIFLASCPSEDIMRRVVKYNLNKYKMIHFVIKVQDEEYLSIPVTKEGMGFQIRGSNPCVVHSVAEDSVARDSGLLRGHAIFKVNGALVTEMSHDDVAKVIRDGCVAPPKKEKKEEEKQERSSSQTSDESVKVVTNNSLSAPSPGIKRGKSFKKKLALKSLASKDKKEAATEPTEPSNDQHCLELLVGNRHLERTCFYTYLNVNSVKNHVIEKMSETPSIFDLAAQLLNVLAVEDSKVLEDVNALKQITPLVADVKLEVFKRRQSLRYDVIQQRLEDYKKYKRHLISYMWPSYKMARDRPSRSTAKDFCPTNCHVNLMTVCHAAEKYNLKGFGLSDSRGENDMFDVDNMVCTTHSITCAAAPSFRTSKREGHGLMAVLRGAEGNTDLMDSIRHLMVALDNALLELKQGQRLLNTILHSEAAERDKRSSLPSTSQRDSYQYLINGDDIPNSPIMSPVRLGPVPHPKDQKENPELCINVTLPNENGQNEGITVNGSSGQISPIKADEKANSQELSSPGGKPCPGGNEEEGNIGNGSDCDSGIHSNRGSLIDNEKMTTTFTEPPPAAELNKEQEDGDDKTNRTSGISANMSDRLSVTDDYHLKGSSSTPTLRSPPPIGACSTPSKTRSPKTRPRSGRHRFSYLSTAGSTCSSEDVDSLNFAELELSPDALDKLHGTMEHFLTKIQGLQELVTGDTIKTVFKNTQETTPKRSYNKIIDEFQVCSSPDSIKMSLAICNGIEQVADVINTLVESVEKHVAEVRTQLVLSVLLNEDPKLVARRDKVFSQALIIAISSFSTQLRCAIAGTYNNMKAYGVRSEDASRKWLEQCMSIGACIIFQTMLNPSELGECAMLEDSVIGVNDLERVTFHFKAITGEVEPNECPFNVDHDFEGYTPIHIDGNGVGYSMEGNRCALKVFFHLEKHVFIKLPPRLQAGGGVKLVSVLINHGLHDLDTQLYEQGVTLQEWSNSINERGFEKIYDYYKKFRAFHFDRSKLPRDTEARAVLVDKLSRPLNALDEVVTLLEANVKLRHGKPNLTTAGCGALPLTAEYCQRIGACSAMACPNGSQRCTTSCCIQQSVTLATCHGLPPKYVLSSSYQMTKIGARSYAETKNPEASSRPSNNVPRLFRSIHDDSVLLSPS